jgi:hypothetical protein
MHNPQVQKLLIESRVRDVNNDMRRAPRSLVAPRPRRWRLRSALPSTGARFAV